MRLEVIGVSNPPLPVLKKDFAIEQFLWAEEIGKIVCLIAEVCFLSTHKKLVCLRTSKAVILNRDRTLCSNNDGKKYLVKHGGEGGLRNLSTFTTCLAKQKQSQT